MNILTKEERKKLADMHWNPPIPQVPSLAEAVLLMEERLRDVLERHDRLLTELEDRTSFKGFLGEKAAEAREQSAKEQVIDELDEELTEEDFKKGVKALFEHARLYGLDVPSDDHMAYSAWRKERWPTLLLSTLLQSIGYEKTANAIRKL